MKALIINGSHRSGNTDIIIKKVISSLENKKIITRELVLRDIEMKLPDGCEHCAEGEVCPNIKDEFSETIEPTIRDYDVYILATPTYDDGVTPLTKIFWDRIVSWCGDDQRYLENKTLAVITHGMSDSSSWNKVVNWVEGICEWEGCTFGGKFTCKSDAKIGTTEISNSNIHIFVEGLFNGKS